MNSYPPELIAQLAPVMFVAGLGSPPPATSPQSPAPKSQDPFAVLAARLKETLSAQRKVAVWAPDKSKTFQVVLVDPDMRFPPRKMPPSEENQFLPTHSPLSPLTPSSPLYPDGLIAPIWIRKHTTLVPSVFVLFKRIYESPRPTNNAPLDLNDTDMAERELEERRRDTELAAEIALRKKSTNERSIKLTVVLMASRRMLDDPTLDGRLTYIRRQSGLDPRAALFVLSPVAQSEIGDFVRSLQEALWEPAIEYYTNHSKRVRRKRNRHSQANTSYALPVSPVGSNAPRPLRPEGWTVRYEYKMACFAEFRGEDEVALKHYQDAYSSLLTMFGSTAILPPRTKRWAEAKVLADCISVKVCKLYLYNGEHALALAHHTMHMRKFADLSRGWGIGEETFEFWSWLARQHRIFAELLEQGVRSTLKIPTHLPSVKTNAPPQPPLDAQRNVLELDSMRVLGLNPTQALQHPGFYYYMAARCTENRRMRFLQAVETKGASASSPGFVNESKVDHLTIILELYTRSYELFKKYSPPSSQTQGRQTLWIAYRIAQTYYESGKFDMAVRFFERIAKTYRREKWDAMLIPLLSTWYACAQQLGDMELGVQLLIEMLTYGSAVGREEPDAIQEDLLAVLKSTVPSYQDRPLIVDVPDAEPLLETSVVFWSPEVKVGERAVYQLSLTASPDVQMSSLPFTSLAVYFGDELPPIVITHKLSEVTLPEVQRIDLGHVEYPPAEEELHEVEANLRWQPGAIIVFSGTVASRSPATISVSKVVLTLKESSWWVELPLAPTATRSAHTQATRWLKSTEPPEFVTLRADSQTTLSSVTVRHRPHNVQVSLSHNAPAYVGEEYPITIEVINADDRTLEITTDVLLQPSEIEAAVHSISYDRETWTNLIKGVSFGILAPGVSVMKTLYLTSSGAAGDRVIDISVQSRNTAESPVTTPVSPKSPTTNLSDTGETLRTVVVPTVEPIAVETSVTYSRSRKMQPPLADFSTYDDESWDGATGEATVVTSWRCLGPHGLHVESVQLVQEPSHYAKVLDSVVDSNLEDLLTDWFPGDEFCDQSQLSLHADIESEDAVEGPGVYEISWRR
ncbi:hypothetical protein NM688_g3760 [Phlebia brevispora]|uniref:Uncharacterized protein n=1 Tax=Phlebia brevispora TaxID=194682 RepID=A0ACC1T528_9APHY|nr:hypothetical protein NM688_g3760 [Phlebia brevispora]